MEKSFAVDTSTTTSSRSRVGIVSMEFIGTRVDSGQCSNVDKRRLGSTGPILRVQREQRFQIRTSIAGHERDPLGIRHDRIIFVGHNGMIRKKTRVMQYPFVHALTFATDIVVRLDEQILEDGLVSKQPLVR